MLNAGDLPASQLYILFSAIATACAIVSTTTGTGQQRVGLARIGVISSWRRRRWSTITTVVPLPSCHTYDDPNFLLTFTPTLFLDATYSGRFNRFISRDGNELIPGDFYEVRFSDGSSIEIAVNPDQISQSFGSELVEGFGRNLGSAPEFLRNGLDRLQISHVSDPSQTGGGFWVTQEQLRTVNLHISFFTYDGELKDPSSWPWTKEVVFRHWDSVLIHELAHHFDLVNYRRPRPRGDYSASSGWAAAQAADGSHISEYAKTNGEEDFAETMKFYLPLRYMPERWCPETVAYIQATIPNRIRYLDANLNTEGRMCPVVQEDCIDTGWVAP